MKNFFFALLIGLSITGIFMEYSNKVQGDIANNIFRLHIIANSDSDEDQSLKLKVRDCIISYLSKKANKNIDLEQTKQVIAKSLDGIKKAAEAEVWKNGYSYPVAAQIGNYSFPTKHYNNFSLPRGNYDALRVVIGSGGGQNWWCVLYPNLCFVDGVVAMPDNSREKLDGVLTEDEISLISDTDSFPVKIKFKLVEFFSNLHI